jgi:hypothetical protein
MKICGSVSKKSLYLDAENACEKPVLVLGFARTREGFATTS